MDIDTIWGGLAIAILCPLLGALPLVAWTTVALSGKQLRQLGTGNVSVSAAFYHGGRVAGIVAVLVEAGKGIAAVLLARAFFADPVWELLALIALVVGRYWGGRGAGATNVTWGILVHDWGTAFLVATIGGISFTLLRDRRSGRLGVLVLFALVTALRHPREPERAIAAAALAGLLGLIYERMPDDLDLPTRDGQTDAQPMFQFFRGDRALKSLDMRLDPEVVGAKAATLAELRREGYPVPPGWVLPPGDDPQPLLDRLDPSPDAPLIVRSSALGEDSDSASAAGVYQSVSHITSQDALRDGILTCQSAYSNPSAAQYRRDRHQRDRGMAAIVQQQIRGAFSGVAFSRDPVADRETILVEGLPGEAAPIASGRATPQQYRVQVLGDDLAIADGDGDVPLGVVRAAAHLARTLEERAHGVPQDIEWTYDGQQLWLLQARPVTTLLPIWTRKIAAEVIPGAIAPLTWSINRPLTCGVWGDLFGIVLGDRVRDLDFNATATLHYSHAYFNATLLGQIFRRAGLPAESLEFLTRGAKFSKPPLTSTLRNLPGLLRLARAEWTLGRDFITADRRSFASLLARLEETPASGLPPQQLLLRAESILATLERATYFNILAPLSLALRQTLLRVPDSELDNRCAAEVASVEALAQIAADARNLVPLEDASLGSPVLFSALAESPDGESIIARFRDWLDRYGYLSEAATDIAVPRWKERPRPARELLARLVRDRRPPLSGPDAQSLRARIVQKRLQLKAEVAEVYNKLLAHLRWSFTALERHWLEAGVLAEEGEIFLLELEEVSQLARADDPKLREQLPKLVQQRREVLERDRALEAVPFAVYRDAPARETLKPLAPGQTRWQGIGASPGVAIGVVRVLRDFARLPEVTRETILVVPYTDSGWSPLLAQAGGVISEVGGRLSHGAILAREYGIPAVMDVTGALRTFQDGQRVRVDGQTGTVESLAPEEE